MIDQARAGQADDAVMGDLAQRQNDLQIGEGGQRLSEIGAAVGDFWSGWLVFWWQTFDSVEDDRTGQRDAVVGIIGECAVHETEVGQGSKEHFARCVPGERPAGTVSTFLARGQAYDRKPGVGITKSGNRSVPPVGMVLAQGFAQSRQPGTATTAFRCFGGGKGAMNAHRSRLISNRRVVQKISSLPDRNVSLRSGVLVYELPVQPDNIVDCAL